MNELALKYGCNPNQKPSRIYTKTGKLAKQADGAVMLRMGNTKFLPMYKVYSQSSSLHPESRHSQL